MFVRKDKDGNLVGVGSIDYGRLTQLQGKPKKASAKVKEPEKEPVAEPKDVEPKDAEPKVAAKPATTPEFKSALDLT